MAAIDPPQNANRMRPLRAFEAAAQRRLRFVLCDIDDTLTVDGRLPAVSYTALERLQDSGLKLVPITGRPAGWCDHFARMWPIDGVVGENGAFYFRYDRTRRRMVRRFWKDATERAVDRTRLAILQARILAAVPGAAVAADQSYRESDLAIDVREDAPPLPEADVARIVALFEAAGATAKLSSIHVNGWFGDYDKLAMTLRMLRDEFAVDAATLRDTILFVGDSPNDAPMFAFFPNSVGVANVRDYAEHLSVAPAWVTEKPGGYGFAELAEAILAARGAPAERRRRRRGQ
jgi:HAD superfamily hydrolase (TIGR01484 family)